MGGMTRQQLARLVDDLPEDQLDIAAGCLLYLRDSASAEQRWDTPEFQTFLKQRIQDSLEEEDRGEFVNQEEARDLLRRWRTESAG